MIAIVAGALLLWLGSSLLRQFLRANPASLARQMKRGGGFVLLCLALLLLVRGQVEAAAGLGAVGFWLTSGKALPVWDRLWGSLGGSGRRAGRVSRVRSVVIEMELHHGTGVMSGRVLAGPYEGWELGGMDSDALNALHAFCTAQDLDGLRLLEAYFDRRFPGWRAAAQRQADGAGTPGAGARPGRAAGMSEQEAYELLGVAQGASREDIARAHRTLMKKAHPDHGGSTDAAARVNEAKDVLMRRHLT